MNQNNSTASKTISQIKMFTKYVSRRTGESVYYLFQFFHLNIKRQNLIIRSQKTCILQFLDSKFFFAEP